MNSRSDKYSGHDDLFDEEHGVLRNRLGITDAEELGVAENECLIRAYGAALAGYDEGHRFDEEDVRHLHRLFLGPVFEWAGTYRRVDISSPGIRYCHAAYIEDNMKAFSKRLAALTPFSEGMGKEEVVRRPSTTALSCKNTMPLSGRHGIRVSIPGWRRCSIGCWRTDPASPFPAPGSVPRFFRRFGRPSGPCPR